MTHQVMSTRLSHSVYVNQKLIVFTVHYVLRINVSNHDAIMFKCLRAHSTVGRISALTMQNKCSQLDCLLFGRIASHIKNFTD